VLASLFWLVYCHSLTFSNIDTLYIQRWNYSIDCFQTAIFLSEKIENTVSPSPLQQRIGTTSLTEVSIDIPEELNTGNSARKTRNSRLSSNIQTSQNKIKNDGVDDRRK
jgi:hypothetical protein